MIEEVEHLLQDLHAIAQNVFQNWKELWKLCVDSGGEYCKGDKPY
jgi:hypothetical protein